MRCAHRQPFLNAWKCSKSVYANMPGENATLNAQAVHMIMAPAADRRLQCSGFRRATYSRRRAACACGIMEGDVLPVTGEQVTPSSLSKNSPDTRQPTLQLLPEGCLAYSPLRKDKVSKKIVENEDPAPMVYFFEMTAAQQQKIESGMPFLELSNGRVGAPAPIEHLQH